MGNKIDRISEEDLIKTGIARRMYDTMVEHSGYLSPVTFPIEECRFWVEELDEEEVKELTERYEGNFQARVHVIVEHPNRCGGRPRVRQAFLAMRDESFGVANDAPLNEKQLKLLGL